MSYTIAGSLDLTNASLAVTSLGTEVVHDALTRYFAQVNSDLNAATALFVDSTLVEKPQIYVREDTSGYLQVFDANSRPENMDDFGGYTLGFPLYSHGAALGGNRITLAYMTVADLDQKLRAITNSAVATLRRDILETLFDASDDTFVDPIFGSVTVKGLANGDTQTYQILGSTPTTDTHQLYPNYALASVSATNNPMYTLKEEIGEHLGSPEILFIAGSAVIKQLKTTFSSDFISAPEAGITYRDGSTALLNGVAVPGRLVGKFSDYGWIAEWRHIPANYMMAVALDGTRPLKMRVDPASTGLPRGLALVAENENYPFKNSYFDYRYGIGGYGRVSAAVLQFGSGGSYSAPTVY